MRNLLLKIIEKIVNNGNYNSKVELIVKKEEK